MIETIAKVVLADADFLVKVAARYAQGEESKAYVRSIMRSIRYTLRKMEEMLKEDSK